MTDEGIVVASTISLTRHFLQSSLCVPGWQPASPRLVNTPDLIRYYLELHHCKLQSRGWRFLSPRCSRSCRLWGATSTALTLQACGKKERACANALVCEQRCMHESAVHEMFTIIANRFSTHHLYPCDTQDPPLKINWSVLHIYIYIHICTYLMLIQHGCGGGMHCLRYKLHFGKTYQLGIYNYNDVWTR